ncbi:MAG: MgtC/SapB family protein [Nanoarchaeota archaeon]|nr:MgtC/SapB family protein [Nanoarchaeota archaeon]
MIIDYLALFYKFFLALSLGALIGVEREKSQQHHQGTDFAGIRTFMLLSMLGATAAYISSLFFDWILAVILVCVVIVILAGYVISSLLNKHAGMTTELSAILAFTIGILCIGATPELPITLAIVTTMILSFKQHLHQFVYNLKSEEFFDTLKFILIAFVVLPLLKNIEPFGPYDSINLYEIWLMVVFVSGFSFVGYILMKHFGSKKGVLLTGMLGGILSSTAVVTMLASKSKEDEKNSRAYVTASAVACATMFLRLLVEMTILNISIIEKLAFPVILISIAGYLAVSLLWKKESVDASLTFKSPLMLEPALKFGLFYGLVQVAANISAAFLGSKGLLVAALISGVADVDAVAIYVARSSYATLPVGIMAIILAGTINTVTKIFIGRVFGSSEFGSGITKALLPMALVGFVLFFILG